MLAVACATTATSCGASARSPGESPVVRAGDAVDEFGGPDRSVRAEKIAASAPAAAAAAGAERAGDGERALDAYVELYGSIFGAAAVEWFEDLRRDLRSLAAPLPDRVVTRLRPFFSGQVAGEVHLSSGVLDRAAFVVDPERMEEIFALLPTALAAVTIGDVIVFAPGAYQPDCVEGLALIAHELVHVAQYTGLGRDRFLERYFLVETVKRSLGAIAGDGVIDLSQNRLEVAAYCHQEAVCRALAGTPGLAPCDGHAPARCTTCPGRDQVPSAPGQSGSGTSSGAREAAPPR